MDLLVSIQLKPATMSVVLGLKQRMRELVYNMQKYCTIQSMVRYVFSVPLSLDWSTSGSFN